jgi:hypothetical protein
MATTMTLLVNYVDADVDYQTTPADFIALDLANDYLIWSEDLDDLMTHEPTTDELNEHAVIIDEDDDKMVPECLLMDKSHDVGGSYYTHLVIGMGDNKKFVFAFSFDGATANEPQLEAWDDSDHDSTDKHVLGAGTPADSMVKAICTTTSAPGASWTGTAIAGSGATRVVKLNDGSGALPELESGEVSQELYANIKIVIPQAYATPAIETFVLTVRFTWQ